jgi:TM2 domain-containing membrane protein YozV
MSESVSQLNYWRHAEKPLSEGAADAFNTKEGGSGAAYLSYNTFLALSVLGGFFALDHLYLRSPLTFLAKIVINILFLGVWWLYDASQAVFNRDTVKVFGLQSPGIGFTGLGQGIGAGVLASDVPDKKHMAFFYYALAVLIGGAFGVDFFLTGNNRMGFLQLFLFITFIFAWVPIVWWIYKSIRLFVYTDDVIKKNHEYFGLPTPKEDYVSFVEKLILNWFPFLAIPLGIAKTTAKVIVQNPEIIAEVAGPFLKPVTNVAETALHTADAAISTVQEGIQLGRNVVNKGTAIVDHAINTVDKTAEAATAALSLAPQAAALSQGFTPGAVGAVLAQQAQQKGGSDDIGLLPYVFLGTIGIIAVSGLALSFLRSRQNERPRKDDSPPEPGVLRKPDQEKSTRSA